MILAFTTTLVSLLFLVCFFFCVFTKFSNPVDYNNNDKHTSVYNNRGKFCCCCCCCCFGCLYKVLPSGWLTMCRDSQEETSTSSVGLYCPTFYRCFIVSCINMYAPDDSVHFHVQVRRWRGDLLRNNCVRRFLKWKTRQWATLCFLHGFTLEGQSSSYFLHTTNVTILISILQTFRSWIAIFHFLRTITLGYGMPEIAIQEILESYQTIWSPSSGISTSSIDHPLLRIMAVFTDTDLFKNSKQYLQRMSDADRRRLWTHGHAPFGIWLIEDLWRLKCWCYRSLCFVIWKLFVFPLRHISFLSSLYYYVALVQTSPFQNVVNFQTFNLGISIFLKME